MRPRKIDDGLLLKMLKEGRSQTEIAKAMGVSNVAVHKRIKRIAPPPCLDRLTDKQKAFVVAVAKGTSATASAMGAYDVKDRNSAKAIAHGLMKHPEIEDSIKALMEYHGLTKSYRIGKLKSHVDNTDPNISLKALDMSFKLDSSYPPTRNINLNVETDFSPVDLSRYRRD